MVLRRPTPPPQKSATEGCATKHDARTASEKRPFQRTSFRAKIRSPTEENDMRVKQKKCDCNGAV